MASTNSEVSCQVTNSVHRGFITNPSRHFPEDLLLQLNHTHRHACSIYAQLVMSNPSLFSSDRLSCSHQGSVLKLQVYILVTCFSSLNKYLSLTMTLFCSITSLSRSIMTTRRLWSCAQRTSRTVMSGWLLSHRPGTFRHMTSHLQAFS